MRLLLLGKRSHWCPGIPQKKRPSIREQAIGEQAIGEQVRKAGLPPLNTDLNDLGTASVNLFLTCYILVDDLPLC
jgi:hypothetical protein